MFNQTIESKLLFANTSISNSLNNKAINAALTVFGYDEPRLQQGLSLYEAAHTLHLNQVKEYGEQFAATDYLKVTKAEANKAYMRDIKIARIALKNNRSADESMLLKGARKESLSGWLKQAKTFYANALASEEVVAVFSRFNLTPEKLRENQAKVAAVEEAYANQLKEKGEAQTATLKRDEAFDSLQNWMSDFVGIARIALETEPQYLEVLGIVEPS